MQEIPLASTEYIHKKKLCKKQALATKSEAAEILCCKKTRMILSSRQVLSKLFKKLPICRCIQMKYFTSIFFIARQGAIIVILSHLKCQPKKIKTMSVQKRIERWTHSDLWIEIQLKEWSEKLCDAVEKSWHIRV